MAPRYFSWLGLGLGLRMGLWLRMGVKDVVRYSVLTLIPDTPSSPPFKTQQVNYQIYLLFFQLFLVEDHITQALTERQTPTDKMADFKATLCSIRREIIASFVCTLVTATAATDWQHVVWDGQLPLASNQTATAMFYLASQHMLFLTRVCLASELQILGTILASSLLQTTAPSSAASSVQSSSNTVMGEHNTERHVVGRPTFIDRGTGEAITARRLSLTLLQVVSTCPASH